ncbi:hypothetical protein [Butyrivibrio fibrisolvens]|uniref:hypothetical protein n=1 Tax=Butyrivibrio fibrisolvens TaxID=831 RepID=UPI0004234235|nr:hypothetical protein [Butyrivibrio fibrisolvens]
MRARSLLEKLHKDNNGMSMVMAIVVISFVGLLLSIIMYMALYNFEMKSQQFKIQENYYSAEMAMNEISAGLQMEASGCFSEAYISIMQKYSESLTAEEKAASEKQIWQKYKDTLIQQLSGKNFNDYVTRKDQNNPPYAVVTSSADITEYEDFVRITNVKVVYTDETGDTSIIETDINIKCPDIGFNTKFSLPIVVGYSLIADDGIEVKSGNCKISNVSVYAGKSAKAGAGAGADNQVPGSSTTSDDKDYAIVVDSGAGLSFENCPYIVAGGDKVLDDNGNYVISAGGIVTDGNGYFHADENSNVWATNIRVGYRSKTAFPVNKSHTDDNYYNLKLLGNTFVKDDLTIGGRSTSVKLGGGYYGYGQTDDFDSAESSAIIFNGTNVEANFSELTNFVLLGNAYIGLSYLDDKKDNLPMGESLTSKAGQLAYLVPYECVGWYSYVDKGTAYYSPVLQRNPLPYADYYEYYTDYSNSSGKTILPVYYGATVNSLGASIADGAAVYGLSDSAYASVINQDGWMYFYMDFSKSLAADPQKAAGEFFKAYYEANPERMDRYLSAYISDFKFPLNSGLVRLNLAGNILIPKTDASGNVLKDEKGYVAWQLVDDSYASSGEYAGIDTDAEAKIYDQSYYTLCTNLSVNYDALTGDEKDSVYQNLISDENINELKGSHTGSIVEFKDEEDKVRVIVCYGDYTYSSTTKYPYLNMIITVAAGTEKGDVSINTSFKGTIISSGEITIKGPCSIENDPDELSSIFTLEDKTTGLCVANLFRSGEDFSLLEKSENVETIGEATINTADLVTYSGWKKY